jgi:DnaJ like chaperone protein
MSLWSRISEALAALAKGESFAKIFDSLRNPPERSIAFTIAVIALGAKMAKADGQVTRDEVTAFREVFHIAKADEENAARVFNLARQDVADMFSDQKSTLSDLIEGLFHIALADGFYHPNENVFLERVATIFGLPPSEFRALRARFVPDDVPDPYSVLEVAPDASLEDIRAQWRKLVRATHPDAMMARGVPEEAVRIAEKRMIDINRAWDEIRTHRDADPGI